MGARRVTPQEILQMQQLYAKLGTYAAVQDHGKKWFDCGKVRADEGRACDSTDYCTEFDCAIVDDVD